MKLKSHSKKLPKDVNLKTSASNFFLNIIIIFLAAIIIFLGYSLFEKIRNKSIADRELELQKAAAPIVQVEVLNGCGISGVAEKFTDYLRNNNFDVVQMGNYKSFDIGKTLVVDRTGSRANAEKVAKALGVSSKNIIQQINKDYLLDVSIIIGKDFNQLKPNN